MEAHLGNCAIGGTAASPEAVLAQLSDEELEAFTKDVKRHVDAGHAWLLRAVEELDRRQVPERHHVLTTRQWLKRFCRMTGAAATAVVAGARSLAHMPDVADRAEAGEIPHENLRQVVAARTRHPEAFALHEPVFADIATYLDARDLRRAIGHWQQQVDHALVVGECDDRRARRRMTLQQTVDGMWHHEGWYDPESGHVIAAALRAVSDPGLIDPDDRRTHGQRMVDGLVDVCRFSLDHGRSVPSSGGTKPHVTVTVGLDQLTACGDVVTGPNAPLPEIDGTSVPVETIRRLACDAGVVRIVVGPEGEPLDVGRSQRTVTPAIRRALDLRDRGCRWDGCDRPASWCDAHHVRHWARGGATSLDNMVLLCRRHHTAIHDGIDRIADPPMRPPP